MTTAEIINAYNSERPNSVDDLLKISWVLRCEKGIADTILKTHQGCPSDEEIAEHFDRFDMDTELYVDEPYDDIYIYYLDQRIAMNQNDTRRYNAAATMYNNALLTFQQKYNREHKAIGSRGYLIKHEVL